MLADYLLPVAGGFLCSCSVADAALTPVAGGRHCARCQRLVHDFRQARAPAVAPAGAANLDGRLCGWFVVEKTVAPAGFSRRLRCFVVALVLIVGRGLTAQAALAQVRPVKPRPEPTMAYGMVVEQMPTYKGGGLAEAAKAVQQHFSYSPTGRQKPAGKVYVSFEAAAQGKVQHAKVLEGSGLALVDTAAVQAVRMLDDFKPGLQNNLPVPVGLTIPVQYVKPE